MKYFMQSNVELLLQSSYHQVFVFNQLLWSTTVYFVLYLFSRLRHFLSQKLWVKNFLLGQGQLSHAPCSCENRPRTRIHSSRPAWKLNVLQFQRPPPDDEFPDLMFRWVPYLTFPGGYPTMWPIPWCIWCYLPAPHHTMWTDRCLWKHYFPAP